MSPSQPSTLQAEGLQKRYGSRTVVRDVSIEVKSGEVVGLLGPNGAGKTTSFYMIVGLVPLDGGAGAEPQGHRRRAAHGAVRCALTRDQNGLRYSFSS